MDKISYCATHNTYPADGEPCWQCANKHIETALEHTLDELETYRERHRDAKSNFATIQRLREENKALRANVSRSVLRRLDAQLGGDDD